MTHERGGRSPGPKGASPLDCVRPTLARRPIVDPDGGRPRAPRLVLAVQYAVAPTTLPAPATLRRWARAAVDRDATVTLRFVGKREGRTLNALYRGKEYATNVLAFVYDEKTPLSGDVVVCAPVLRQEARAQGKPLANHCAHLVVHGMLHLQGYDHHTDRAARAMEARESAILATLGLPDPYAGPNASPR